MGPPPTLISIVKLNGVSHAEKGWDPPGPTASHRTRFGSHVEKNWDPLGPTEPNLGPTVEKSSDPPGPTKYVSGHVQGWWFLRARFWVQKMLMLPACVPP